MSGCSTTVNASTSFNKLIWRAGMHKNNSCTGWAAVASRRHITVLGSPKKCSSMRFFYMRLNVLELPICFQLQGWALKWGRWLCWRRSSKITTLSPYIFSLEKEAFLCDSMSTRLSNCVSVIGFHMLIQLWICHDTLWMFWHDLILGLPLISVMCGGGLHQLLLLTPPQTHNRLLSNINTIQRLC